MKKHLVHLVEEANLKNTWPEFKSGDTISVSYRIEEGGKERSQIFKGTVISRSGRGMSESFTVRKLTQGYGVERIFPVQSPFISSIKLEKSGRVRRAKLYYLRDRSGRSTRIAEKIVSKTTAEERGSESPAD